MELEEIVKKADVKVYDDLAYEELTGVIYRKIEDIMRIAGILAEYTRSEFVDKKFMDIAIAQYNLPCKNKVKEMLINKVEFKNKAEEKLEDYNQRLKLKADAVIHLQSAIECYLIDLLKLAKTECKKRTNTDEIEPKDIQAARRLIDDCNF